MDHLEQQLKQLGKALAPRSNWVESVRADLLARGAKRHAMSGMTRFMLHMPLLFPRTSSALGVAFMMVLAVSVSVNAAQQSLPGNAFYSLKRTIEKVELKAASPTEKPQLQISQAERRLKEAGVLAVTTPNSPKIKESLDEFSQQIVNTTEQIDNISSTPAERAALAQTIVDKAAGYTKVLDATRVVVAPPLQREARQAKHLVSLSTVKAVETLVGPESTAATPQTLIPALQDSIKTQVASLKTDTKEAADAAALLQIGSTKRTADEKDADTKVRVDLVAKANETIGSAEYLVEKGDYRQAAVKVRQTLEYIVKLEADPGITPTKPSVPTITPEPSKTDTPVNPTVTK